MEHQKTAVIDFDNTIAGYDYWRGTDVLGPPVPYAKDAVLELLGWGWRVVIFTTRGNVDAVKEWLFINHFPSVAINSCEHNPPGCSQKPIGEIYFDDRDAHVVGHSPYNWHSAMARGRHIYQPRLDTYIDDASCWASWFKTWFIAPIKRARFQRQLKVYFGYPSRKLDP